MPVVKSDLRFLYTLVDVWKGVEQHGFKGLIQVQRRVMPVEKQQRIQIQFLHVNPPYTGSITTWIVSPSFFPSLARIAFSTPMM